MSHAKCKTKTEKNYRKILFFEKLINKNMFKFTIKKIDNFSISFIET